MTTEQYMIGLGIAIISFLVKYEFRGLMKTLEKLTDKLICCEKNIERHTMQVSEIIKDIEEHKGVLEQTKEKLNNTILTLKPTGVKI